MTLTPEIVAELERLRGGCSACDYDEAEGSLMCHCAKCQFKITCWVWEHAPALLAAYAEAERLREAIQNEPELPGDMPDDMWDAVQHADRETMTEILRAVVRATKSGILRCAALAAERGKP